MLDQLAVVVVNYGSSDLLAVNLVQLCEASPEVTVVVVDNFSTAGERSAVGALAVEQGWHLVELDENRGFGGGVNVAARKALDLGCRDLLVLNPDALIKREAMLTMARAIPVHRRAIAAPVIRTSEGRIWFAGIDLYLESGEMRRTKSRADFPNSLVEPWLTGACLWITREAWEAIGEFDESYFLYWEDVDYSVRARRAGCTLLLVEGAEAIHDEGGTQRADGGGTTAKSMGYYYYNIRNRMLFATKHLDADGVRRWRRADLTQAWGVLLRGGRRQFLHSAAPIRAALRGIRDGRRIASQALRPCPVGYSSAESGEQ